MDAYPPLVREIARFVTDAAAAMTGTAGAPPTLPATDDARTATASLAPRFDELARRAFAFQHERIVPFRRLCEAQGVTPTGGVSWRQVPAVPAAAFRRLTLAAAPAVEVFRSSGTSGGSGEDSEGAGRSVHHHPFPELYRRVIDASFPTFCLASTGPRPPLLALVPARDQLPDSSLSFMVDHLMERQGGEGSAYAFGPRGVDWTAARSFLGARQRDRRPALVLATSFAIAQLLERLDKVDLRFRLPPGSALFETGGFKGRHRELEHGELLASLEDRLGIPAGQVVQEYGMTELTSQCYSGTLRSSGGRPGGEAGTDGNDAVPRDGDLFLPPPWMRVRVLDPESLEEAPAGEIGILAIFDLANVGSAVHLLTEDLGSLAGDDTSGQTPFRLHGRATGAALRGCSLVAEELGGHST